MRLISSFRFLIICAVTAFPVGCSEQRPEADTGATDSGGADIRAGYRKWAEANAAGNVGLVYDLLDSAQQADMNTMAMQWAAGKNFQGVNGREAFIRMIDSSGRGVLDRFKGEYEILQIDTIYTVTVQHKGKPADLVMFRWENGEFRYTAPPNPAAVAARRNASSSQSSVRPADTTARP